MLLLSRLSAWGAPFRGNGRGFSIARKCRKGAQDIGKCRDDSRKIEPRYSRSFRRRIPHEPRAAVLIAGPTGRVIRACGLQSLRKNRRVIVNADASQFTTLACPILCPRLPPKRHWTRHLMSGIVGQDPIPSTSHLAGEFTEVCRQPARPDYRGGTGPLLLAALTRDWLDISSDAPEACARIGDTMTARPIYTPE